MILSKPWAIIEDDDNHIDGNAILRSIERAARTCYKSEEKHDNVVKRLIADETCLPELNEKARKQDTGFFKIRRDEIRKKVTQDFIRGVLKRGHESVIEHEFVKVRVVCDRGVSHELVRHRLCAISQESTRYVNYSGGCQFIIPPWCGGIPEGEYRIPDKGEIEYPARGLSGPDDSWFNSMAAGEWYYRKLLSSGWTPQQARSVLPNSTKTELVMTANIREWRHVFNLRTSKAAHPQMREIMIPLLQEFRNRIPVLFDDVGTTEL